MVVGVTSSASAITAAALVSPHACKSLKILAVALVTDSPLAANPVPDFSLIPDLSDLFNWRCCRIGAWSKTTLHATSIKELMRLTEEYEEGL